jgi:hypothetical protein
MFRNHTETHNTFHVRRHHCERLIALPLLFPQFCDGFIISCITGKVKSADTLDGDDAAVFQ